VTRGELYPVRKPGAQVCAPLYSRRDGLITQVRVGPGGFEVESSIHCDELVSLPKSVLTRYVGSLKPGALDQLNTAPASSLGLEDRELSGSIVN
jgi:mRNA interferase MazF